MHMQIKKWNKESKYSYFREKSNAVEGKKKEHTQNSI